MMPRKSKVALSTLRTSRKGKRPPKPFRSWFEYDVAGQLKELYAKAKYEPLTLPYNLALTYTPDWVFPNGVILEAKGKLDYDVRRKMLAVQKANPDKRICIVFMKGTNPIIKGSKTTYMDWALAHGFEASDGIVNPDWLK